MFYGPGAGAGPTASAMVGDLMQIMCSGRQCAHPMFVKDSGDVAAAFDSFVCRNYLAFREDCGRIVSEIFNGIQFIESEDETLVITAPISEGEMKAMLDLLAQKGLEPISRIRLL